MPTDLPHSPAHDTRSRLSMAAARPRMTASRIVPSALFAILVMGGCASRGGVISPNVGPAIAEAAIAALANGFQPLPSSPSWKLSLYGGPGGRTYLGCLWCEGDPDSVLNPHGPFGRSSTKGVFNRSSVFGHPDSNFSPCNWRGTAPPMMVTSGGTPLGRLTINTDLPDAVQVESIKTWIADACAGRSAIGQPVSGSVGRGLPEDDARVVASTRSAAGRYDGGVRLARFTLSVQRTGDRVSATCDVGCRWRSTTPAFVRCETRRPCLTITDARAGAGVSGEYASFAVTIDMSSTGMAFACERGCAWKTRDLDCEASTPCSVRIGEFAVTRVEPAKTH